jgi:hypothetical protein
VTKPTVYIETSVISYLVGRASPNPIASGHQATTQLWWRGYRRKCELFISKSVWEEIVKGDPDLVRRRKKVVQGLRWLQLRKLGVEVARSLLEHQVIPETSKADAFHIAIAAEHGIEFVITWNFAHIANAAQRNAVRAICERWGFAMPILCTPEELIAYLRHG